MTTLPLHWPPDTWKWLVVVAFALMVCGVMADLLRDEFRS